MGRCCPEWSTADDVGAVVCQQVYVHMCVANMCVHVCVCVCVFPCVCVW